MTDTQLAAALEGLRAAADLCDKALPCFNWGASALTAEAIQLLNEAPGKVRRALLTLRDAG